MTANCRICSYLMLNNASSCLGASAFLIRSAHIAANSDEHCAFASVLIFLRSLTSSVASRCVSTKRPKPSAFCRTISPQSYRQYPETNGSNPSSDAFSLHPEPKLTDAMRTRRIAAEVIYTMPAFSSPPGMPWRGGHARKPMILRGLATRAVQLCPSPTLL